MEGRSLTYFVSDVHLGVDSVSPGERERRFVDFLRGIPSERTSALYLLGDIWDFWYEYRDVVPKGNARVFAALMDLMDAGVKVYFFQGNHDMWCFDYFRSMGIEVLQQPYVTKIGDSVFCLGHGDGLGPCSKRYKAMRATFRNPVAQKLFSTLHPWFAFRMGRGWSARRQKLHAAQGPYVWKGEAEPLYKFAEEFSKQQHVDYFIFGHFHTKVKSTLPDGAGFFVLGDWKTESNYLYFDGMSLCEGNSPKIVK